MLSWGWPAEKIVQALSAADDGRDARQVGLVSAKGDAATFTGPGCNAWAGGRRGVTYAVQGNILTGPEVVEAMEKAYLETKGDMADRMMAALLAGDAAGGDSRGRQSAALVVCREGGGYGGNNDRYIDIRVDDHAQPFQELQRLLDIAHVNGLWNLAWAGFMRKEFAKALPVMERTAELAERTRSAVLPEVLYDLAVIRGAAGKKAEAVTALRPAVATNPKLAQQAAKDHDLDVIRGEPGFGEAAQGR
jgi:hypothetical protein